MENIVNNLEFLDDLEVDLLPTDTEVFENYNTAEDAFNSLNIGTRFEKVPCRQALKKIFEILDIKINIRNPSLSDLVSYYTSERRINFVDKTLRIGMTPNGSVVLFADVYGDHYSERIKNIVNIAKNNNINIEKFHKKYAKLRFQNGWVPPEDTKYHWSGYSKFYRGNLVGLIVTP